MRYERLIALVKEKQPKAILEIGTWNGRRALEMLMASPDSKYYGFDLFEDSDAFTDAEEKNVKPHYTLRGVKAYLDGFDVVLHKGNTRATLKDFDKPVDFVWLDGGHSVETVRSDWENVKRVLMPGATVLFDDYYTGPIDTRRFGCNEIVKSLNHEVLPDADPVSGGGFVQMVRVWAS
jgi:predicted O-methyltransferase YrrM